jgi:hypothetical protein
MDFLCVPAPTPLNKAEDDHPREGGDPAVLADVGGAL